MCKGHWYTKSKEHVLIKCVLFRHSSPRQNLAVSNFSPARMHTYTHTHTRTLTRTITSYFPLCTATCRMVLPPMSTGVTCSGRGSKGQSRTWNAAQQASLMDNCTAHTSTLSLLQHICNTYSIKPHFPHTTGYIAQLQLSVVAFPTDPCNRSEVQRHGKYLLCEPLLVDKA